MELALVAAVGSLIIAVLGLVTSGKAKQLALRAEGASRRSEQVRLRATAAGEALLAAMAELMLTGERILFQLSSRSGEVLTLEEAQQYATAIERAMSEIRRIMYSTALYTTPAIRERLENLLGPIYRGKADFSLAESFVVALRAEISDVAAMFHDNYVK